MDRVGAIDRDRARPGLQPATRTASARLRRKIALVTGPFADACRRLVEHRRIVEVWPEYLATNHAIIRATVPLFEAARDRARDLAGADPVAAGVASYLDRHIVEELDHDEWLLEDLEVLGVDRSRVVGRVPSETVASLVGSQYYWALHVHPVAVLGYLAFMEGFPPAQRLIEDLIARTGYPREAFRTLAEHGELDHGHREEIDATIDGLPLDRRQEALLGIVAISGMQLLTRCVEEVVDAWSEDGGG